MSVRALVGLSISVAASLSLATSALAQSAAQTSGGDVTADEATPLPPVVVSAPKERARKPAVRQSSPSSSGGAQSSEPVSTAEQAAIEGGDGSNFPSGPVGVFTLGQLDLIGGSTITNEAMWTYNKQSLDSAVNILPGVSSHNTGGARNERDIYVRGFDRYRVPLSVDGVRIYLPADNRLDFGRFLTSDLAEVQVQKGYVSVLNGPGGLGGSINLVSRKPTKEIELEGRTGATFDGDLGSVGQWSAYAFGGTRQKGYYAQVSGNIVDQDHFSLSNDFSPSPYATPGVTGYLAGFPYERGGDRDRSDFQDWRINAKAGITPNATDEYSVNYTVQQSKKAAPLHTDRQAVQGYFNVAPSGQPAQQVARFWDWPQWDVSTLSWLSKTQLGSASYVKTNAFYNTFDNITSFYPDARYSIPQINSPYEDNSVGGFVEVGTNLIPMNTLKGVIHYRRDEHNEGNIRYNTTTGAIIARDRRETRAEEIWSFAAENTFHATRKFDLVTGVSYDTNDVLEAAGAPAGVPLPNIDAWNGQAAAIYSYSDSGKGYASVSSRTRFPTLFERYSTRFGSKMQNPDIDPERATNYEIGFSDTFFRSVRISSAVFYTKLDDSIQNAFAGPNGIASIVGYSADGENHGFEISADWDVNRDLRIGGNYTYLERDLDFADAAQSVAIGGAAPPNARQAVAASQVENTPRHEAFVYVSWKALPRLTLTPSVEIASDRTALVTSCQTTLKYAGGAANSGLCGGVLPASQASVRPNYTHIGSFATVNLQAEYEFSRFATGAIGVTNLFDDNYELADGFPEPGRMFFANMRAKF